MSINKAWHLQNKMPKNATESERERWHSEHEKHCNCRPTPAKIKERINKKANPSDSIHPVNDRSINT